jgi:hypothetical protein
VRVWNFGQRKIIRTITVPGAPGLMEVRFISGDPEARAYTAGFVNGLLYLVSPEAGTARPVFNLNTLDPGASPQVMTVSPDGRRLFVPMDSARGGEIVMFDITNPAQPRVLDKLELGPGTGPHDTLLTRDHRLVVTDYFHLPSCASAPRQPMHRGQLPVGCCRHARVDGPQRPSGRTALPASGNNTP